MSVVINGTTGITAAAFDGAVDAADLTGTLPSSTLSTYLDPENRIINGAFDFWQRGTSSTAQGYLADRWVNGVNGGTVTQSRQAFSAGDTLGSNNPTYFLRQTVSGQSLTSHYGKVEHPIEGVRSYAGQTITLLGWARRSSGSGNMAVEPLQYFGSGGSPSSVVYVSPQTVTLTGSWAPFAVTIAVPSISGKTLGTNNNDFLSIAFWTSGGSDYNARTNSLGLQTIGVDLWGIHIKQGTHTTSAVDLYRQPELGPELARCQRYFWKSTNVSLSVAWGAYYSTTAGRVWTKFSQTMRAVPSMSYSSNAFDKIGTGGMTAAGISGTTTDTQGVTFDGTGLTSATLGNPLAYTGVISADAEL
jgi:hypothetical protein